MVFGPGLGLGAQVIVNIPVVCVCVCGMCTISVRVTCMSPDLTNLFIRWHNSKPADTGPAGCLLMAKRGDSGGSKSVLGSQAVGTPLMRRLRSA